MGYVAQIKSNVQAVIDIQTDEVTGAFDLTSVAVEQAEGKLKMAVLDQAEKCFVEGLIKEVSHPAVEHRGHRMKYDVVLCPSHLRVGLQFVNGSIGAKMALGKHAGHTNRSADLSSLARREFTKDISRRRVHVRFVERDPAVAQVR